MRDRGVKPIAITSAILGALLVALFFWEARAISQFKQWPTTDAVVVKREITVLTNPASSRNPARITHSHVLSFAFRYEINGHQYLSQRFFPDAAILDHSDATDYPVGSHFQAHYNPAAPEIAVAESGNLHYAPLMIGIICVGFSVVIVIFNYKT